MDTTLFFRLIALYRSHGYGLSGGFNPSHFGGFRGAPGMALLANGRKLETGGGISPGEVGLIQDLSSCCTARNIFIVGNAFGWSAFALALAFPGSSVVALDAGSEGVDNRGGLEATQRIAAAESLPVCCVAGWSPADVGPVIAEYCDAPPDLFFIDGLHTREQLWLDYQACREHGQADACFLLHDVVSFKLQPVFARIRQDLHETHDSRILWRSFSGMALCAPRTLASRMDPFWETYTEPEQRVRTLRAKWRLLARAPWLGQIRRRTP